INTTNIVALSLHAALPICGEVIGPLHGLPIAHKDLVPTKGIRTTWGSPIYRDHVPDQDALIVERLRGAGAITIGKTNVPEFGARSEEHTSELQSRENLVCR